ncbi:MAG: DPP IV N-terminal domain-containing protein, partial [Muribaculaceae bacterium]|nr:DPP IV N-terminal domain-containing protein [Muribaculaceae bacterium]
MLRLAILLLTLSAMPVCFAQGTVDDYNRAYALGRKYNYGHVDNARPNPQWIDGTHRFWYINEKAGENTYTLVDADSRKSQPMFDHKMLAKAVSDKTGSEVKPGELRLEGLRVSRNADTLWFNHGGLRWMYLNNRRPRLDNLGPVPAPAPQPHWMVVDEERGTVAVKSPDGRNEAFIRDNNVWVRAIDSRAERQLTTDGTIGTYYSSLISW